MKLTVAELAHVRSQGLYVTEKCDGCGALLNQTVRYTIAGKPEVYCSAACRDLAFFGDTREVKKRSTPGKCVYCGASLEGKRRGALYCDEICKKRAARAGRVQSTAEPQITGTPTQSNQRVTRPKVGGQEDCIASEARPFRDALDEVAAKSGLPVEVGQATLGSRSS
jgi:Fe-S-cluster-containing dehydrogenase component